MSRTANLARATFSRPGAAFDRVHDRLSVLESKEVTWKLIGITLALDGGAIKTQQRVDQSAFLGLPLVALLPRQRSRFQISTKADPCLDMPKQSPVIRVKTQTLPHGVTVTDGPMEAIRRIPELTVGENLKDDSDARRVRLATRCAAARRLLGLPLSR